MFPNRVLEDRLVICEPDRRVSVALLFCFCGTSQAPSGGSRIRIGGSIRVIRVIRVNRIGVLSSCLIGVGLGGPVAGSSQIKEETELL